MWKLLFFLVVASSVALGQGEGTHVSPDQQPAGQEPSGQQQAPPPGAAQSVETTTTAQTEMKGCLRQSGGNWVLAAENGQTINLSGDSSMLAPHDGRQVQVLGTPANSGSFLVSAVSTISDSCTSPR